MQISSHPRHKFALPSPPATAEQSTPNPNDPLDTFQAAPRDRDNTSYLGVALLGFAAISGFAAGRVTLPQAETLAKQEKCECPAVDLSKDSPSADLGYQNPDDWKQEIGGGRVSRPERNNSPSRDMSPSKPTSSQPSEREDYPDAWKENIGGGSYDSGHRESSQDATSDWQGPDDWKAGL